MILRSFLPAAGMAVQGHGYDAPAASRPAPLIAKDEEQMAENAPQQAGDAPFHA
jgi:hypothetical protein